MLRDKVDLIVGNHDSAVRQAIVGAVKGKIPYVYSPVYEVENARLMFLCWAKHLSSS